MPEFNDDATGEITSVKGIVEKITYKNEQNGYTVAIVRSGKERITVTGCFPFLSEGESAVLTGRYIVHPVYGRQFSADSVEKTTPETAAAILKYLASGAIKGIGPATAVKIVERFGKNSLEIIENDPSQLSLIKGISAEKAALISDDYKRQFGIKDLMIMLSQYGFSPERCVKIYKALGKDSSAIIKNDPYALCRADIGVSFETAEQMAPDFGIEKESHTRLCSGIEYIVRSNLSNGHTCLPRKKIVPIAVNLLESDEMKIEETCDHMVDSMVLMSSYIGGEEYLSLSGYYSAEEYIAARLRALSDNFSSSAEIDDLEIDYVENKLGIKFEDIQREAVKKAFKCGLFVLTGGPGTGKTTTLNAIIDIFERRKSVISLAAPTGRAAKRMTELTGRESRTIHRLLEVEWGDDDKQTFQRNERNPLEADVLIVDEASMLDSLLFESVLRALKLNCRLILVGDVNQLPSIGAGNVLGDIISSGRFNTVELKKVFRQAKESAIITNAHAIINGTECDLSNKTKDFFFINTASTHDAANKILELCCERLGAAYGFDPLKNIQVICPSRKLDTGTANLNNLLQSCINPQSDKPQLSYKGVYFRTGDKVMQIKNNYDIEWEKDNGERGYGVYNGDVGFITLIERATGRIEIRYDDRVAKYCFEDIEELELAYAITVHKSQGSEFDCVVLPVTGIPGRLMYRNLLYTAVTRAKKLLVIVGDKQTFYKMASNDKKTLRYTLLSDLLKL